MGQRHMVFGSYNVKTIMIKSSEDCIVIDLMNTNAKEDGKIKVNWCCCERVISSLHNKPVTLTA